MAIRSIIFPILPYPNKAIRIYLFLKFINPMIKQKDFIGSKLTFIFQVSYSCLIKSINRKRLLHSSLPSGYSFIITSQILLLLQLQL